MMAEYSETIYSESSNNGISRLEYRATVGTSGVTSGSTTTPYSYSIGEFQFPAVAKSTSYPKKQLNSIQAYGYVLSSSGSANAAPYQGTFLYGRLLTRSANYGFAIQPYESTQNSDWRALNTFSTNSYNLIFERTGNYVYGVEYDSAFYLYLMVAKSENFLWYTDRAYTIIANMSISPHGSVNPPYMIRKFIDAVPFVTNQKHNEGRYFAEHQVNSFTWDMYYYKSLVVATLQLKSSVFNWRVKGSSTINNVYLGEDIRYVSIPSGTFPRADIEWQVQVTTDDNISSQETTWFLMPHVSTASIQLLNFAPQAGFVNEKIPNIFSWGIEYLYKYDNQGNIIGDVINIPITQQSATFQWRNIGASQINSIPVIGSTTSITVPANTFPDGSFEWRISEATTTDGGIAPTSSWFVITTVDPKPNKPTGLYPNTGSRDGTKPIQFSWIHNSPLSTPQSAFELQVTYDGGTTWQELSNKVITEITQFNAAVGTILPTDPTGRIGWRVRTYNSDDVVSDWSDTAFFIVHPAPQAPSWVSVETGRSRPLSRWISTGQVGFQLQVLFGETVLFDSGEIHGTQTEYRIPTFLNNGVYTFRVRIKNVRGLYSDWSDRAVSINARHSLNITLTGEPVEGGAALSFNVEVR